MVLLHADRRWLVPSTELTAHNSLKSHVSGWLTWTAGTCTLHDKLDEGSLSLRFEAQEMMFSGRAAWRYCIGSSCSSSGVSHTLARRALERCLPIYGASEIVYIYSRLCVRRAEKFSAAGHVLLTVALPAAYVADLQKACKLMGIRADGINLDLACMVLKDKLADLHDVYKPRTVAATRKMCSQ